MISITSVSLPDQQTCQPDRSDHQNPGPCHRDILRRGIIAADPKVLPLGSVVRIQAGSYSGIYTVMDTGGAIKGRKIDIYIPTRKEAIVFGARKVKVEVLRRGWEPEVATTAAL